MPVALPFENKSSTEKPNASRLTDDACSHWLEKSTFLNRVDYWANRFSGRRRLAFHYIRNTVEDVSIFLGLLQANHTVALLDPKIQMPSKFALEEMYKPELIVQNLADNKSPSLDVEVSENDRGFPSPNEVNCVLLSTSGSTGSPKFVRLSIENLYENALAIAAVLDIKAEETGCCHLPLHYSYGLSVLTSHLVSGADVLLTERGFIDKEFWARAKQFELAHLPGVPFHYQTLRRLGVANIDLPKLRVMTQAGGSLDAVTKKVMHEFMQKRSGRFHVMYGQTEASPRITTLSHNDYKNHPQSVGTALPGGKLSIIGDSGEYLAANQVGEVVYIGSNVMLGYAQNREDLLLGDTQHGILRTGDLGKLDDFGRLTLTGRMKRSAKIAGLRVNLDDIERATGAVIGDVAVIEMSENLMIYYVGQTKNAETEILAVTELTSRFNIPKVSYKFRPVDTLPRTARGKIDYSKLEQQQ